MSHDSPFQTSRRELLKSSACGFGYLALAGLQDALGGPANLANRMPVLPARAKRVIFLFMQGGPSQVDTFDPKPRLTKDHGKKVDFHVARTRQVTAEPLFGSPWEFKRHGQSGRWVSSLFPQVAKHVDDLCFIHSMHTEGVAHGPATLFLHTGATNLIRPSMGSWVTYGLGTENANVPGFVTIGPPAAKGGPRNYSNAFLPSIYQGTALGRAGLPASDARFKHITHPGTVAQQRKQLDLLQELNHHQLKRRGSKVDEAEAVIASHELAFRLQSHAPDITDLSTESEATQKLYGIGEKATDDYGRQCLIARRMAEAGVRYIQVNYADNGATPKWDQHSNLKQHETHARNVDLPISGLLMDLKQRGLLEDTLVWWGGEFGRTPYSQNTNGRDHNPNGFTVWLAGAGVNAGYAHGATDEFGYQAIEDKVHMHDLHATVLHLLGLDHEQLTYRYAGRDFRLTDVHGAVIPEILT